MSDPKFGFIVDGVERSIDPNDLGAADDHILRKEFGFGFTRLVEKILEEPAAIDLLAGFVWICRRHDGEPGISYMQVAASLGFTTDFAFIEDEDVEVEPEGKT